MSPARRVLRESRDATPRPSTSPRAKAKLSKLDVIQRSTRPIPKHHETTKMRSILTILGALALAHAADLTLRLTPSPNCDIRALPPSTHATLSTLGAQHSAPLTASGEFVFRNVSGGSYLGDVHCPTHAFAPVRVDIREGGEGVSLEAWETSRGNDWGNKGEAAVGEGKVNARCLGGKTYFMERPTCECPLYRLEVMLSGC